MGTGHLLIRMILSLAESIRRGRSKQPGLAPLISSTVAGLAILCSWSTYASVLHDQTFTNFNPCEKLRFHEMGYSESAIYGHWWYITQVTEYPGVTTTEAQTLINQGWVGVNNCVHPRSYWDQFMLASGGYFPSALTISIPKGRGPKNNGQSCPVTGNPINTGSGNKFQAETDISGSGERSIQYTRYYNSAAGPGATDHGRGWTHTYSRGLVDLRVINGVGISAHHADGKVVYYSNNGTAWISDNDVLDQLTEQIDSNQNTIGWTLHKTDNSVEQYDASGRLVSIIDILGNSHTLTYNLNSGLLENVATNSGEYLTFTYDTEERITTVSDNSSPARTWNYRYDANGHLEYVDNPDGTTKKYHYEDALFPHALTGITDERGIRYATYGYDAQGRANLSTHADNAQRVDIVYNSDGTRTVTNSRNIPSTYNTAVQLGVSLVTDVSGPGCSACNGNNTSYSYAPTTNNLLSKTENGITTEYGNYGTNGNPGYKIEAAGTAEHRRTDYTYDPRFHNKATKILEPSVFATDPTAQCTEGVDCKKTEYTYDDWGNRLTETISGFTPDGTPVSRTTTYQYNGPLHQLSQIDGPRTDVSDITTFEYYPDDPAEGNNRARLKRVTAANGTLLRDTIGYTPTGQVAIEYRPNNILIYHSYYPGNDRLQSSTEHDTSTGNYSRTTWTYLATGEVESITIADATPDATTLTFGYDAARRLVRITDGAGNYIQYTLDTEGNLEKEDIYDANGTLQDELDDILKKALTQTFDAYNRLDLRMAGSDAINPLEQTDSDFAPDGTLGRQTGGNGVVTDFSYDSLKRLLNSTQDPDGAAAVTRYGYDAADNLTSVIDPVNGTTTYTYDDLGNLLSTSSPDTGMTLYTYDEEGNVATRQDARGQVFSYSYDALNRLTGIVTPVALDDISYEHDACSNGIGRLCSITQGGEAVTYAYDAFGNVTDHQQLAYSYDAANRIKTTTYPSGAVVTYSYDAAGQVSQVDLIVAGTTTPLASGILYEPFGTVTDLIYGNGTPLAQTVDTAYRLTAQTVPGTLDLSYPIYDSNGNLLARTDAFTGSSNFTYDTLNRLDTGSGPFGIRDYDYDLNGNRTQLISDGLTTSYGYSPQSNLLTAETGWSYTLDANGNTTHKLDGDGLGRLYAYNSHNRLITAAERLVTGTTGKGKNRTPVIEDVTLADYSYNGLGQRVRKTRADGTVTQFLYGTDGALLAELDDSGAVQREYVYLNGQLLATVDVTTTPGSSSGGGAEVVVDNGSAGTSSTGSWTATSDRKNTQIGSDYLVAAGGTGSTHRWDAGIIPGSHEVFAWWVSDRKAGTTVPFTIVHANGTSTVTVDQTGSSARWVSLGVYDFTGNGTEYVEVSDANGKAIADAVRFVEQPVVIPPTVSTDIHYVHNDHLGTPQAMTDEAGTVVWRATYDPFGKATIDGASTVELNVRFPGQYYDQETGLHYNYFRYYDPSTGRYISSDPIGLWGGLNTYAYVGGNPLMFIDPFGLAGCHVGYPGYPITIPGTSTKVPLTHAGVLSYDAQGHTRYYEYGRYDSDFGEVKRRTVPDLEMGPDGKPTPESWKKLIEALNKIGHGTEAKTSCDDKADADKINDFAEQRMNDPNRAPYSWNPFNFNTCTTFANDAMGAGLK